MEGDGESEEGEGMKRPAVFIDRDGTVNEQMGYINHLSRFVILPGLPNGLRLLNKRKLVFEENSSPTVYARRP